MRYLRRFLAITLTLNAALCVVLLLNFTAPNPTGRRYASEMPLTSGTADSIGRSAELILAKDLRQPLNSRVDQRKCICNSTLADHILILGCHVCVISIPLSVSYRLPDFFADTFIAEVKNTRGLNYEGRELDQIAEYAQAARQLRLPLYVYTRVNTQVDAVFERMVAETGGAVVRYFPVLGWSDPVDIFARNGLLISLGGLALLWLSAPRKRSKGVRVPVKPRNALHKAIDDVDAAQGFTRRTSEQLREELD